MGYILRNLVEFSEGDPEDRLGFLLERQEGIQNVRTWHVVVNVVYFYSFKVH